jgi:hypothetical protein
MLRTQFQRKKCTEMPIESICMIDYLEFSIEIQINQILLVNSCNLSLSLHWVINSECVCTGGSSTFSSFSSLFSSFQISFYLLAAGFI